MHRKITVFLEFAVFPELRRVHRRAVDQIGTAQVQRVAVHAEEPCHRQPDRIGPVRRARGEKPDLGASKCRRVHLGANLVLVGGAGVLVKVVDEPYMRELFQAI